MESVNCIQLPVVQGTTFQSDGLAISTPGSGCVMKSLQSPSPPIIAFPQLQSIRFVQTSFNPEQETTSSLANNSSTISAQLQPQQNNTAQVNMTQTQDTITQINTQNNNVRNNMNQNTIATPSQVQNTTMGVQSQNRAQNAIVIQHQTATSIQPRQIAATMHQQQQQQQQTQQQQYAGPSVTVSSRSSRVSSQGSQRGSRNNNKEQGGGRSRSSTKEPPGAVNLERSYQICQAVN